MSCSNQNNPQLIQVPLASITADASVLAGYIPKKSVLLACKLVNNAGIAQSDTDYVDIQLKANSVKLAGFSTKLTGGNGPLVSGELVSMVLEADVHIPADSKLEIVYDETGTIGMTSAHAVVMLYPL